MNKQELKTLAYERIEEIEQWFNGGEVLIEILTYYRLQKLIFLASFEQYFMEFGPQPITIHEVTQAKKQLGHESITQFERECILILEEKIQALRVQRRSHLTLHSR